jgi:phosphomannomutase
MPEPIISVSGLRGIVGESVTPDVAVRYVCAFAATLPPGPVVVTRDGRATGPMLADLVRGGLAAVGTSVLDAGVAATPTTGVLVRQHQAAGGIQISASHNPAEYNGLKLFSAAGRVIPADEGQRVLERYHSKPPAWARHDGLGSVTSCHDPTAEHCRLVLATVDAPRIAACRFKVLLDANRGAGGGLGRRLLEALGCRLVVLGEEADGRFDHPPEPTAENLVSVLAHVRDVNADIGFCQDPDADRLAVIDHSGRYLGEEHTLAICVEHVLRRHPGPIVTNCSSSRVSEDLAARHGVPFFRSAVGEANVVDRMLAAGAVLGGEGNGGVIDPRVGLVRDSFAGMALILDAMAARSVPVSQLADELPRYEIVKSKVRLDPQRVPAALAALERHFADASCDRLDGLRLDWPGKWLLVRASNTEPIVRAIAEAEDAVEARRLCDEAAAVLARV